MTAEPRPGPTPGTARSALSHRDFRLVWGGLFASNVGNWMQTTILDWDATSGGRWRYVAERDGEQYGFHGCFHHVDGIPDRGSFFRQPRDGFRRRLCQAKLLFLEKAVDQLFASSRTNAEVFRDLAKHGAHSIGRGRHIQRAEAENPEKVFFGVRCRCTVR